MIGAARERIVRLHLPVVPVRPIVVFLFFAVALVTILDGMTGRPAIAAPITTPLTFTALSLVALTALAVFIARTINLRSAIYAVLILATTPEWFTSARTDASPLNAFVILGVSMVGIAAFDNTAPRVVRVALLLGLALALALRFIPSSARPPVGAMTIAVAIVLNKRDPLLALLSGAIGGVLFIMLIRGGASTAIATAPSTSSFTTTLVARTAYGLAPWSALLPFAILSRGREPARHAIVLALVLTLATSTIFQSPALAVGLIAASTGLWLADLDSNHTLPVVVGVGAICMGLILARDLDLSPDRVLDVLSSSSTTSSLPSGHSLATARMLRIDILALTAATFVLAVIPAAGFLPSSFRRGMIIVAVGFIAGAILRERAYPDLIRLISPGRAFEAWNDRHQPGDEIALLGVDPKRWPSSASTTFNDSERAVDWLTSHPSAASRRRFLAIGPTDLARANAAYRQHTQENLPIVAGEGAFLLGVSSLVDGETSDNPLNHLVRSTPPRLAHSVTATLGRDPEAPSMELLGWSIADAAHQPLPAMRAHQKAHLQVALRVGNKPAAILGHCTFIHVEHTPTRYGAEHRDHASYPIDLWHSGDIIIDDFEVDLPPHFGRGSYALFWGVGTLPCQDDQRMPVITGAHDGHHRLNLGRLEVR